MPALSTFGGASARALGWSLSSSATANIPGDLLFNNVRLLLRGESTVGKNNNVFLDSSSTNYAITRYGNVAQGSFSPYSLAAPYDPATHGGSAYFDGNGDYLTLPANDICNFGSGDFTVEFWMYPTAFYNYVIPFATSGSNTDGFFCVGGDSSGNFSAGYYIGGSRPGTSQRQATLNAWNHVVAQRASGVTSFFLNGIKASSDYTTTYGIPGGDPRIGINPAAGNERFTGWLSDLRVTKGQARYAGASSITVPTAPVSSSGANVLHLRFNNAGIYDESMYHNFETVGDTKISATSKYGNGSIVFDGSGDWLEHGDLTQWAWLHSGSENWTIEWWMNMQSTFTQYGIICTNINSISGAHGMVMGTNFEPNSGNVTGGAIAGHFTRGTDGNRMDWFTPGGVLTAGQWNHIAVQFNSSTKNVEVYVNGISQTVSNRNMVNNSWTGQDGAAFSYSGSNPTYNLNIGRAIGGASGSVWHYNGLIDDMRITRGVRRYTSNFTPPTSSLPNRIDSNAPPPPPPPPPPAVSLTDYANITAAGAQAFSYISMPGGSRTVLNYLQSFGINGNSSNDGSATWNNSFSGNISYVASPITNNNYFTQYGRVRVIDGDGGADGLDWAVFNFGAPNGSGDFDGTADSNAYFGGESSYSGGSRGISSIGQVWGFNISTGWTLLYQLPLGSSGGSSFNHAAGNWFSSGGTVSSGNGKRAAYDSSAITHLGFAVL